MTTTGALTRLRAGNAQAITVVLAREGALSRADLVRGTGLSRATVSSLVAELIERGLVSEGEVQRVGSVGRPGQTVELAREGVVGVGVEVNADFVDVTALDLTHDVVLSRRTPAKKKTASASWRRPSRNLARSMSSSTTPR